MMISPGCAPQRRMALPEGAHPIMVRLIAKGPAVVSPPIKSTVNSAKASANPALNPVSQDSFNQAR